MIPTDWLARQPDGLIKDKEQEVPFLADKYSHSSGRQVLFILLSGLLALIWMAAMTGCGTEGQTTGEPVPKAALKPSEQFFGYKLVETELGVRQWTLESDEMRKYTAQEDVELFNVKMNFFRDGTHFSTLTADSGKAHLVTHDVHTWGDVVVVTDDGRQLDTQELFFSNETQLIHNDVFNVFTRETDVMTGIGLEATPDLEYIEIKEQVEAEVSDQESETQDQPRPESDLH